MRTICVGAALLALCLGPAFGGVVAISDWENAAAGVDGWSFLNDGNLLTRVASGGNPGGFLQVTDSASGTTIYFVAPSKFLGNQSAAYGGSLAFNLQQSFNTSFFADNDVMLISPGTTLVWTLPAQPAVGPGWSTYSVSLLASAGWKVGSYSGSAATETDMQNVLANLTGLQIRAEYQNGVDVDGVDNVVLTALDTPTGQAPEPSTMVLLGAGCVALWLKRRA